MKYRKLKAIIFFLLVTKAIGATEPVVFTTKSEPVIFKINIPVPKPATSPIPKLMKALEKTESKGKRYAVGDNGEAFGVLQVHESMVQEYNRITGRYLSHSEMFTPEKARMVADVVLRYYANHILSETGRPATAKELAFIWNGGGEAWTRVVKTRRDEKQRRLETYWNAVSNNLIACVE